MRRPVLAAATVVVLVLLAAPGETFAQCAMCRRALESPEGRQLIGAFRGGILLLLTAPFAVFGTVAVLAVRRFRRQALPSPGDIGETVVGKALNGTQLRARTGSPLQAAKDVR